MTTISDQTGKPRRRKTGGRRAGTPNKVTCTFRAAVAGVLEANRENVGRWLDQVANGTPAQVHDDGSITPGQPPDPAKALEIIAKLAEYAAPKLARTEVIAARDHEARRSHIQIEFVNAPLPAAMGEAKAGGCADARMQDMPPLQPRHRFGRPPR